MATTVLQRALLARHSPSEATRTASLPVGWFALSPRWHPHKQDRRRFHGSWFVLQSEHAKITRILRYSPVLQGAPGAGHGDLVIDWSGWMQLTGYADDFSEPIDVAFRPATFIEKINAWYTHPDPTYRLAVGLGVVSLALGVLSLVLAAVPLFQGPH